MYNEYGHLGENGRKSALTHEVISIISKENSVNSKKSLRKIKSVVDSKIVGEISHTTVKKGLNLIGKYAYSPLKRPLLSDKNIERRLSCSSKWLFMEEEAIKSIIFSDESKFNLFYSDGKVSVWREPGSGLDMKNIIPTVKHGGCSVMVWACFSYYGIGKLTFIEETMDAPLYCYILGQNLMSSASLMGLNNFIFQQDNDPKHTSKLAKQYFESNNINLLDWPAQSPDMNPIENLWAIIKEKIAQSCPKNKTELKDAIMKAWESTPLELLQKLSLSFRKRALALYRAKGKYTKY